ncbi:MULTISPECIES: TetR/AcrR family transcriptional regulator [Mesorhizobium]|nr:MULTISPECIES: TetR/AcrR family transcriptional regulator [Mesorhizobium]
MMSPLCQPKITARDKILAAAVEISHENGAANLSLDAVAARAGVSKGGLLYHFPSKAALMRAMVETFVARVEADLEDTARNSGNLLSAFVSVTGEECAKPIPGAAGVLAAIAEDPDFLKPVKEFQRRLLDRLQAGAKSADDVLLIYLALEGLRSLRLFDLDVLSKEEQERALKAMRMRAKDCGYSYK